jgi:hypothetical protein
MAISEEDPRGLRIRGCMTNERGNEAENNGIGGNTSIFLLALFITES